MSVSQSVTTLYHTPKAVAGSSWPTHVDLTHTHLKTIPTEGGVTRFYESLRVYARELYRVVGVRQTFPRVVSSRLP